ncbi:MAG: glycoside hydrolase family 3 C-terminal domain-containing protein [Lachnospiraceae bacterium]|jgi:beta-glucosidase|nr:glycoside hydrolase family 3 C-terminal domain-containing protein [Lachnospiraceae bacterium]
MSFPIKGFAEMAAKAAAEGAVLLKNDNNILPLKAEEKVSLFGRCQIDYYSCGTGSGGMVHPVYITNPLAELRAKSRVVNEELAAVYEAWRAKNAYNKGTGEFASAPWHQDEMPLGEDVVKAAAAVSDKAIIFIGRTAGEEKDNFEVAGSLLLTEKEEVMLALVAEHFAKVCVVLNVSNIIDCGFMDEEKWGERIGAMLIAWQGGQEGGRALADLLLGNITPSGKLPDTIAKTIADYPSSPYYGDKNSNAYVEDIYLGYRYFATFCPEKVRYEFGYGLSYTEFAIRVRKAELAGDKITLRVDVQNIGFDYAGQEVVQVYYEAPQGQLGQPVRQLLAYQKTVLLEPGKEQELAFSIDKRALRTYNDSGRGGNHSAYMLEAGDYHIYVGSSAFRNECVLTFTIEKTEVIEQRSEACAPEKPFKRLKPGAKKADGTYELAFEDVPVRSVSLRERVQKNLPRAIKQTGDQGITLHDVKNGAESLTDFIAQLGDRDLMTLVRGEGINHPEAVNGSSTSVFGSTSESLIKFGIPLAATCDGPSGIRLDGGEPATLMPIGTLLAASFNPELVEELFCFAGRELMSYEVDSLLGPGMNIHRNPRNGRNFEYYSEDPLLTGKTAAAALRGLAAGGSTGTIKHLACNNQEINRHNNDSVVSERALREIYLRGFEIAVKEGNARSIMTSYNLLNGHWTASNYELLTVILRGEWGYDGIVMTDWWAKMNDVEEGGPDGSIERLRDMVRAGNDLYMVVSNYGGFINSAGDDLEESLANGRLTVAELQERAKFILHFLLHSKAMERKREYAMTTVNAEPLDPVRVVGVGKETGIPTLDGGDNIVPVEMGETVYFAVGKAGMYSAQARIRSTSSNTAQTGGEFYLNDERVRLISTRGTHGKWVKMVFAKVGFEVGLYSLRVVETRPHLEVESIYFEAVE